jgi:hypothetical protein
MMTQTELEERLLAVETALQEIQRRLATLLPAPHWLDAMSGAFKDDPAFEEVIALGRAFREAQPYPDEPGAPTGERPMRTIETTATITAEGTLTVQVPPDIPPGPHHVVVWIDDQPSLPEARPRHDFPVIHVGAWPADLSLRREDMYGDEGR